MTTMTASLDSASRRQRRWPVILAGALTAVAVAMFGVGAVVQQWVAGEHGQFHAMFALAFLVPALILAARRPSGGAASTPVVLGFAALAWTQLVEGVGGFGYGPGNADRVNALAQIHDVGLVIAPFGLIAGGVGVTVGIAQLLKPRIGLVPAIVVAVVLLGALGYLIATMVGM